MLSNFTVFICLFKKPLETRLSPRKHGILLVLNSNRRVESSPYEEPTGPTTASGHISSKGTNLRAKKDPISLTKGRSRRSPMPKLSHLGPKQMKGDQSASP